MYTYLNSITARIIVVAKNFIFFNLWFAVEERFTWPGTITAESRAWEDMKTPINIDSSQFQKSTFVNSSGTVGSNTINGKKVTIYQYVLLCAHDDTVRQHLSLSYTASWKNIWSKINSKAVKNIDSIHHNNNIPTNLKGISTVYHTCSSLIQLLKSTIWF